MYSSPQLLISQNNSPVDTTIQRMGEIAGHNMLQVYGQLEKVTFNSNDEIFSEVFGKIKCGGLELFHFKGNGTIEFEEEKTYVIQFTKLHIPKGFTYEKEGKRFTFERQFSKLFAVRAFLQEAGKNDDVYSVSVPSEELERCSDYLSEEDSNGIILTENCFINPILNRKYLYSNYNITDTDTVYTKKDKESTTETILSNNFPLPSTEILAWHKRKIDGPEELMPIRRKKERTLLGFPLKPIIEGKNGEFITMNDSVMEYHANCGTLLTHPMNYGLEYELFTYNIKSESGKDKEEICLIPLMDSFGSISFFYFPKEKYLNTLEKSCKTYKENYKEEFEHTAVAAYGPIMMWRESRYAEEAQLMKNRGGESAKFFITTNINIVGIKKIDSKKLQGYEEVIRANPLKPNSINLNDDKIIIINQ